MLLPPFSHAAKGTIRNTGQQPCFLNKLLFLPSLSVNLLLDVSFALSEVSLLLKFAFAFLTQMWAGLMGTLAKVGSPG